MQLHTVEPVPAQRVPSALSAEVFTVSGLLSMPAVWTAVVDRALPFDVLLERFLIVLLTIGLLAELMRRLGEGGALTHGAAAVADTAADTRPLFDESAFDAAPATSPFGDLDAAAGASPLTGFDVGLDDFNAPADDLTGFNDLDALGDFDMAPLDLNADPFSDPI